MVSIPSTLCSSKDRQMKIAVYTIAKNEQQFVEKWYNSCKEADYLLIADTGSTDATLPCAYQLHIPTIDICVSPWRFDDARNSALTALPADIDVCIALDMDEVLVPGWRSIVEAAWIEGYTDRLRYNYVWSWNEDGSPGLTYFGDKIHARHGFRWVGPVHEVLQKNRLMPEERQTYIQETLIEHYPDHSKSRSSYLKLLELAVKEDPWNDRNAHYYARDLLFAGRYEEAMTEFKRHLALPTALWHSERAASQRYLGDCYWALGQQKEAIDCFLDAIVTAPDEREGYVALAQAHRALGQWEYVISCCQQALKIKERPRSYLNQPWAWGTWPQEMLDEALAKVKQHG